MCRLFGLIGGPLTPAEPWLMTTDHSLLRQSHASPEEAQSDGWGIAWYSSRRTPRIVKGVGGAYDAAEVEQYTSAARLARGPVSIAHLRHASNPMKLPKERLIGLENSQPFTHGSMLFAHNGSIPFPRETRPLLGKYESEVQGVNDSEVLFWLYVRHVEALGDPLTAYVRTVDDLLKVWTDHGQPAEGPYTGLNILFSRGPNEVWAFCHWRGEHGPGLLDRKREYYQMAYTGDSKQLVVGSEPFDSTRSDWRTLENGTYLYAHAAHGLVAARAGAIPILAPVPSLRPTP